MHRRPRTAAVLLVLVVVAPGCGQTAESPPATAATVHTTLPAGWQPIHGPINEVIEPARVLAAASVPLRLPERSAHGCSTAELRRRLPPDAAAVQLVGGRAHSNLRSYPRRPVSFRSWLDPRHYATYGCSGPSNNLIFRDRGRAFQAFAWMSPQRVHPDARRQTVALLDSLRVSRSPRPG